MALFTAVSGISANQTSLNVIANNIANINTVAFKSSQTDFKTLFSQTITSGTIPNSDVGGTNPEQIGNGTTVASIEQNFSQGGSTYTGNESDLSIEGNGFFTVQSPDVDSASGNSQGFYLTRAGNFTVDGSGNLVTSGGNKVLGTASVSGNDPSTVVPINIPQNLRIYKETNSNANVLQTWIGTSTSTAPTASLGGTVGTPEDVSLSSYSIGVDGGITCTYSNGDRLTVRTDPEDTSKRELFAITASGTNFAPSYTTGDASTDSANGPLTILNGAVTPQQIQLRMATVVNPAGLLQAGSNNYQVAPDAGTISMGIGSNGGTGAVTSGDLESSNVDIASEFTNMIISQRGLEASGKVVTTESSVLQTIIGLVQ